MNITIGQYYQTKSLIHELDPRGKIVFLFLYVIGLFLCKSLFGYCLALCVFALAVRLSNVPFVMLLKGLKAVLLLIVFTVLLNVFFTKDGNAVFSFGIISITDEGILKAGKIFIRITVLIMMSSILTLTTTHLALADAIECFLRPFKIVKVPAHEISMMITIALRFVPTLMDELDKIKLAQMSRGAKFDRGGIVEKVKSFVPLLIPLFISAFRTADNLALAMEARCYRGDIGRTRYKVMRFKAKDLLLMLFGVVFIFAEIIIMRFL